MPPMVTVLRVVEKPVPLMVRVPPTLGVVVLRLLMRGSMRWASRFGSQAVRSSREESRSRRMRGRTVRLAFWGAVRAR